MDKRPTVSGCRSISLPALAPASPATTAAIAARVVPRSRSRTYVSYACDACRKVKVKCDGASPRCSACVRRKSECIYNLETDGRRTKDLKRDHETLKHTSRDVLELFHLLKSMTDGEATEALHHIRTSANPASALAMIRGGLPVTHSPSFQRTARSVLPPMQSPLEFELVSRHTTAYPLLEPLSVSTVDLSLLGTPWHQDVERPGKRQKREEVVVRSHVRSKQQIPPLYLDPQSLSSLNTGAETQGLVDERLRHLDINNWSSVAVSSTLAANAISLYLTNEHPIEGFFDADLFLDDLIAGRTTYCSRLLVNAILACACQSYAAIEPIATKLSFAFYNEAIKHWRVDRTRDELPTVSATMLLSVACNGFGIDATGLTFLHESAAMAHRLLLFSPLDEQPVARCPDGTLDFNMHRARAAAAWGTFNWQTLHSFYFHQVSRTPTPPCLPIPGDWEPQSNIESKCHPPIPELPSFMGRTFPAFCKFFVVVHDMVWLFYKDEQSAGNPVTQEQAAEIYQRLLHWADQLPSHLVRGECSPAPVATLHIWFHTAIIDLFRPFVASSETVEGASPDAGRSLPRDISAASVKQLQRLLYHYRATFDTASTCILWHPAMLYVANSLLRYPNDPETQFYFLLCLRGYQKLMRCYRIASSIAQGLLTIAVRNGVISSSVAQAIRRDLEEESGTSLHAHEVTSRYIIDLDLALTDPEGATMENLVRGFEELEVLPADTSSDQDSSGVPIQVWRGDPKLLLKTLSPSV